MEFLSLLFLQIIQNIYEKDKRIRVKFNSLYFNNYNECTKKWKLMLILLQFDYIIKYQMDTGLPRIGLFFVWKNSLCALGQTAPNPVLSTLKHFREEYIAHIQDKKCPAGKCKALLSYAINPEKCKKDAVYKK